MIGDYDLYRRELHEQFTEGEITDEQLEASLAAIPDDLEDEYDYFEIEEMIDQILSDKYGGYELFGDEMDQYMRMYG